MRVPMILRSYLDESGTHDGSPVTVVSGIIGTAQQWSHFEHSIARLKRKYGFKIFHAKDFKSRSGEFRGWSHAKCDELLLDQAKAVNRLMEVVTTILPNEDFASFYKIEGTPRRVRLDSKYGLCVRYTLILLVYHAAARLGHHKKFDRVRLEIFLEKGHRNEGDAKRVFREIKNDLEALGSHILNTISFVTKQEADPLMVADFVAHSTFGRQKDGASDLPGLVDRNMRNKAGLTQLRLTPEALMQIQDELVGTLRTSLRKRLPTLPAISLREAASKTLVGRY